MHSYPRPYQKRILWNAITGVAIVCLGGILVGSIWLLSSLLGFLQSVLVPLAVAGIIAYLLDPISSWLQQKKQFSRTRALLLIFISFTLFTAFVSLLVIPPLVTQISDLISDRHQIGNQTMLKLKSLQKHPIIEPAVQWATTVVDSQGNEYPLKKDSPQAPSFSEYKIGYYLSQNATKILYKGLEILQGGTSKLAGTFGYLIGFIMVPIYLFYFLKESTSIKKNWGKYIPLKASSFKTEVVETLTEINSYLIAFFRGQMLVAIFDGVLVGIALSVFKLPHSLVIGLFLALLGVIPFIGNILCMIPSCIIAFIHFSSQNPNHQWLGSSPWAYVGAVIIIFLIVQQINSLLVAPKIVGDSVGLHPMTVIFSMLFWSLILGGFLGALLAVPLTASIKVLFRRYIWERTIHDHLKIDPSASSPG